jgi:CheY-like chemotaxis protein
MEKTILCIDDTVPLLQLYGRVFEQHGYAVLLASNGWDGLDALRRHRVDCVILDYEMPEMNGAAVVRHMAGLDTATPVILVSGSDPPRELEAQVEAFLRKPMRVSELLTCVESVIGGPGQHHTGPDRAYPSARAALSPGDGAWSADPGK